MCPYSAQLTDLMSRAVRLGVPSKGYIIMSASPDASSKWIPSAGNCLGPQHAAQMLDHEADVQGKDGTYGTSLRYGVAMDPGCDVMVCFMQNGRLLQPDHGFPVPSWPLSTCPDMSQPCLEVMGLLLLLAVTALACQVVWKHRPW